MIGIEDHVFSEGTSTAARTVRLPRIAYTKATTNNSHSVTIIDKDGNASSNNISVQLNSADHNAGKVIKGINMLGATGVNTTPLVTPSTSIINVDHGSATFVTNGGDWYRIN